MHLVILHHVIGRGIERRKIFYTDYDRQDFIDRLAGLFRARLVGSLSELNHSALTGHSAIMGKIERDWQDTGHVLGFFDNSVREYAGYVKKRSFTGKQTGACRGRVDPQHGGLVSGDGREEKKEQKPVYDQRILGNSGFVENMRPSLDVLVKKNYAFPGSAKISIFWRKWYAGTLPFLWPRFVPAAAEGPKWRPGERFHGSASENWAAAELKWPGFWGYQIHVLQESQH